MAEIHQRQCNSRSAGQRPTFFAEEYLALVVISSALSIVCSQKCGFKEEERSCTSSKTRSWL